MNGKSFFFVFVFLISCVEAEFNLITDKTINSTVIFGEFIERTLTSCILRCEKNSKCKEIGVSEIPVAGKPITCYLLSENADKVFGPNTDVGNPINVLVIKKVSLLNDSHLLVVSHKLLFDRHDDSDLLISSSF